MQKVNVKGHSVQKLVETDEQVEAIALPPVLMQLVTIKVPMHMKQKRGKKRKGNKGSKGRAGRCDERKGNQEMVMKNKRKWRMRPSKLI